MANTSYRVISRGKGVFDVEMSKPGSRQKTVPGFRSEHEANAWIVQATRMIREAAPWTPLAPRKPVAAAISDVTRALKGQQMEQQPIQQTGNLAATRRAHTRAVHERSGSRP